MKTPIIVIVLLILCSCFLTPQPSYGETVLLPVKIDMELLRSLIIQNSFRDKDETAQVLATQDGCNKVVLSNPQVSHDNTHIRLQTDVHLDLATPVMNSCMAPIHWEGAVVLWQRPHINNNWQLSFTPHDSALLGQDGRPAKITGLLWNLIKNHVHSFLSNITINLAPPVHDLKESLLPMFDNSHQDTAKRFLASMRPEQPVLEAEGLRVDILAEVAVARQESPPPAVPTPSPESIQQVLELWNVWDALLVHQISQLTDEPLSEEERQALMDTMLTVRHEFVDALTAETLTNNFVRDQFLQAWQQLAPIFRNHLTDNPSDNLLGYLAFFTANDALLVLDDIGPTIGIDISRDGFYRMAELIGSTPLQQLQISPGVNQKLRKTLGLEPTLVTPGKKEMPQPTPDKGNGPTSSILPLIKWLVRQTIVTPSQAWAKGNNKPSLNEIRAWTAELTPAPQLLPRVQSVLRSAAKPQQQKLSPASISKSWFERVTMATAWQESCFRQFQIKKDKITYLLSYNRSSVGLLQINERVWRGIYNTQKLRWDILYNARAGCEILSLYLKRYIHREKPPVKLDTPSGKRFLAGWLYALYNGGPKQRKAFPIRFKEKKLYDSDKLFIAKYDAVNGAGWTRQIKCLP